MRISDLAPSPRTLDFENQSIVRKTIGRGRPATFVEPHVLYIRRFTSGRYLAEPFPALLRPSEPHCQDGQRLRHYCRCVPFPAERWLWRTRRNIPVSASGKEKGHDK